MILCCLVLVVLSAPVVESLAEARSFVRRQGQCTKRQKMALREFWPRYGVDMPWNRTVSDVGSLYEGPRRPTVLDIGFGHGDSLIGMASASPETNYLGCEVHRPGIGSALRRATEAELENVKICRIDAFTFLRDHLAGGAHFDSVCVFFPDPWFKDKDEHRRLVRPAMLDLLATHLRPRGTLHIATDVDGYAHHVARVLAADPRWRRVDVDGRPEWRPETQYERRGLDRGHAITDLTFALL